MASGVNWKLALILLSVVAGLVVLVAITGDGFSDTKKAYDKIRQNSPNLTVGSERAVQKEVALPQDQQGQLNSLKATLDKMINSKKSGCFESFAGFGGDLGEDSKSTNIVFTYNKNTKKTSLNVANRLGQWVVRAQEYNMTPCVVAGEGVPDNFIEYYVDGQGSKPRKGTHYTPVEQITIFYSQEGLNGNAIRVKGDGFTDGSDPVNDEGSNFEDGGLLYKGSDNLICFFPVNQIATDDDGVNDDEIVNIDREDTLISKFIAGKGNIERCSAPDYEVVELYANSEEQNGGICDYVGSFSINAKKESINNFKAQDNDCTGFFPTTQAKEGCYVFASEHDPTSNDCGVAQAFEGTVIHSSEGSSQSINTIVSSRESEGNDPLCLLNEIKWTNNNNEALLCTKTQAGYVWKSCSEGKQGNSVTTKKGKFSCEKKQDVFKWKLVGPKPDPAVLSS